MLKQKANANNNQNEVMPNGNNDSRVENVCLFTYSPLTLDASHED